MSISRSRRASNALYPGPQYKEGVMLLYPLITQL